MNDPEYKRRAYLAHRFGITIEIYQLLEFSQQGKCALCLQPEVRVNNKSGLVQPLSIDHAHDCPDHHPRFACDKCIRGLLCDHCNLLIGKVEQREFLVKRFADYLEGRPLLVLQEIYDRDLATVADAFWSLVNDGD